MFVWRGSLSEFVGPVASGMAVEEADASFKGGCSQITARTRSRGTFQVFQAAPKTEMRVGRGLDFAAKYVAVGRESRCRGIIVFSTRDREHLFDVVNFRQPCSGRGREREENPKARQ